MTTAEELLAIKVDIAVIKAMIAELKAEIRLIQWGMALNILLNIVMLAVLIHLLGS